MNPNRSDRPRPAPGGQQGFVLVAVLVALVVLTLLATAIATTSERAVQEARENSDAFEAEVAMTSTRDTLLFGNLPELDAMAVATVLTALEDRFGILIDDDEVTGDLFESLGTLADFVSAKLETSSTR